LRRVLEALDRQSVPKSRWELVVVDNASTRKVADDCDLSWHPHGRHVSEPALGVTHARLRGIREAAGDLLVFIDDDNVPAPNFLEEALNILRTHPHISVFGAGKLEGEFEVEPARVVKRMLPRLALRNVPRAHWSNNPRDSYTIPWSAGMGLRRSLGPAYERLVADLHVTTILGRRGGDLFAGEDDLFSWAAASLGSGFGIFPQLEVKHLISADRVQPNYFIRLVHDHSLSHAVLQYMLAGVPPRQLDWIRRARLVPHGLKNGSFSMRCQWAALRGEDDAAGFISSRDLEPLNLAV
jgi:glycosyltransferase involved in cell wall biosynthesis